MAKRLWWKLKTSQAIS
jgi:transcriptional antiterminator NusG